MGSGTAFQFLYHLRDETLHVVNDVLYRRDSFETNDTDSGLPTVPQRTFARLDICLLTTFKHQFRRLQKASSQQVTTLDLSRHSLCIVRTESSNGVLSQAKWIPNGDERCQDEVRSGRAVRAWSWSFVVLIETLKRQRQLLL